MVATAAKSGTIWMLFCARQIRTSGPADAEFGDVSLSAPWPDLIQVTGMGWAERKHLFTSTVLADEKKLKCYWDNPVSPYQTWKSHCHDTEGIKVKEFPKVKFLAMTRNGLDVVSSLIPFFNQHSDEFRGLWGGFSPKSSRSGEINKDKGGRLNGLLPSGLLSSLYFDYADEWWPVRNEPNALLLYYADAAKDPSGTV